MLRIVTLILGFVSLSCLSPACAQVTQQDESLQEQFVPESFKVEATAVASKFNWLWNTTISYTVTNNSGMNLYLGVMRGGVTIGSCTDAEEIRGTLQFLPNPHAHVFSVNPMQGPPRGAFVPAGGRAAGAIVVYNCPAPNPGLRHRAALDFAPGRKVAIVPDDDDLPAIGRRASPSAAIAIAAASQGRTHARSLRSSRRREGRELGGAQGRLSSLDQTAPSRPARRLTGGYAGAVGRIRDRPSKT